MTNGPALSTAKGGEIYVGSDVKDSLSLLDVLYANQFEGEPHDQTRFQQTEENFYRGAPPEWLNFHISELAESNGTGTPFVKRDGYEKLVQQIEEKRRKRPGISTVKLFHQPGCGGTTLATQVLWDLRKTFRCAVWTGSNLDIANIAKEVVYLYTAGRRGHQNTVLLLLNDEQILENLQDRIMATIAEEEIVTNVPVVILLCCVRKEILQSDHVVLKKALSNTEKQKFDDKAKELSRRYSDKWKQFHGFNIMQTNFSEAYVKQACEVFSEVQKAKRPLKTQLGAFLSLLNAYVPGSYLLESQCLDFFKHDDSIHGGLTLADRMQPFSHLIITYQQDKTSEKIVRMAHSMIAQHCTELMAEAGVTRSDTARNLLTCLCKDEVPPFLHGFVKDMLTKREMKKEENQTSSTEIKVNREKFSRLILDIQRIEDSAYSASVLKVASNKFDKNPFFPQALARVYYLELQDYIKAEMWAKEAKRRDPQNSFVADTLGQVHKNHLKNQEPLAKPREILQLASKAIEAFKHEEQLAENECGPDMKGDGKTRVTYIFNTSGQFGFLQVCNLLYDLLVRQDETWGKVLTKDVSMVSVLKSLGDTKLVRYNDLINSLRDDVKKKCDFLNAFLTYSKPEMQKEDPSYLMTDVTSCYLKYIKHPLPDLVNEIMSKFKEDVSLRDADTPEHDVVALLKVWPTDNKNNSFNLLQLIEKMKNSYEGTYAKYFRSRYLCPLFYLRKDEAVSRIVPAGLKHFLLENEDATTDFINYMTSEEKIFRDLRVQGNLLRFHGVVENYSLFTTVGDVVIMVKANMRDSLWIPRQVSFYLGVTIGGLVAFGIQTTENGPPRSCTSCGGGDMGSCKWTSATPGSTTEKDQTYSLQSGAGRFQCSLSGLRWVCKKKVSFVYQFRSWEEHRQKLDMVHFTPGGPLLAIRVTEGEFDKLYLPHWACMDGVSTVSDKFAVLHKKTSGNFLAQVSEVTAAHVKLFHPSFVTHGVLIRAGFSVKAHCNVLIYRTNKKPLTLNVYLIPRDPALQQAVERMERTRGSSIIQKPNPMKSLQMMDYFFLSTDAKPAEISPTQIQLRPERRIPGCFTVFINNADGDFMLTLRRKTQDIWSCAISRDEYKN